MPIAFSRRAVLALPAVVLPVVALAACASAPPPRPVFPELTFGHLGALTFDAGGVEVVNEYVPPLRRPNVEHEMPLAPATAATRWANDRIKAGGRPGRTVRVIIRNAAVREADLPKSSGLKGLFTTEQAARFDAEIEVVVELRSARGFRDAFASAGARRSVTISEGATLNDRDRIWFGLVEELMAELNRELEKNIRQYMGAYLL